MKLKGLIRTIVYNIMHVFFCSKQKTNKLQLVELVLKKKELVLLELLDKLQLVLLLLVMHFIFVVLLLLQKQKLILLVDGVFGDGL